MPSMDWSKVMNMPPDVRKDYNPSADKQSLQIFGETTNDPVIRELLDLNAVGNILKAFLKPAEVDDEGEVVRENGLHYWLSCKGEGHMPGIYPNSSTTESGRPRYWKPNALNLPKSLNIRILRSVRALFEDLERNGELPDRFSKYLSIDIPSVRSVITSPPGMCLVSSDLQTAEIRILAYAAGDEALIKLISEPDPYFVITKDGKQVRLAYPEDDTFPEEKKDPRYILSYWVSGELKGVYTEDQVARDDNGNMIHPSSTDLHWSLVETMRGVPREAMDKEIDRGAGKVGNFSSAYGASGLSLERKIESDTGVKPEPGTGDGLLEALAKRQPRATAFLEEMQEFPKTNPYIQLQSGRRRHFLGSGGSRMRGRDWEQMMSAQGRECRNIVPQESVGSTCARACVWLLDHYITHGMKARPMVCLYDAISTLCPLEEREEVKRLHQKYMCDTNTWTYHGRVLKYPIDTDYEIKWSTKPTPEEQKILYDTN